MKNKLIGVLAAIIVLACVTGLNAQLVPTVTLSGNTIFIIGTDSSDNVSIDETVSGYIRVRVRTGNTTISRSWRGFEIQGILCALDDGNDRYENNTDLLDFVTISSGFNLVFCGDGPSGVQGGRGTDFILGGDGDDVLSGGFGRDLIIGEGGRDQLYDFSSARISGEPFRHDRDADVIIGDRFDRLLVVGPGDYLTIQ